MKIKMAMVGLALGGLVATSAAQIPEPRIEQDTYTAYTGTAESVEAASTEALVGKVVGKVLETKKIQGALTLVAVEAVSAVVELLGAEASARVETPATDVLFDVAAQ